jgi:PIN domain nuclease of toxin-antitoxin system
MPANGAFVRLLLDTQILVWLASGDERLKPSLLSVINGVSNECFTSAVVAFEFVDLERRGRFPPGVHFTNLRDLLGLEVLDFPADAWRIIDSLPQLHRDPVDRMLIAHAIHSDMTLITSDAVMRSYPVKSIW